MRTFTTIVELRAWRHGQQGSLGLVPTGLTEDQLLALVDEGAPEFSAKHPYLANAYGGSLEGYLFPATYRVRKGTTAEQVVEMMLAKFDEEISGIDMTYPRSKGLSPADVVTLAVTGEQLKAEIGKVLK